MRAHCLIILFLSLFPHDCPALTVVVIRRHRSMVGPPAQAQTIVNPILRWVVAHRDTGKQYGSSRLSARHRAIG